jgi:hypothetical protein
MTFLNELLSSLKNEDNKELILPDALSFPSVDIEKLEKEIDLKNNAKINGEKELPTSDSKDLDFIQQKIVEYTLSAIRPYENSFSEAIVAYNARLAALDPLGFDAKIRGLASKKKAEIQMISTQARGEIYLHENNLRQREIEYNKFKEHYGNPADPVMNMPTHIKYLIMAVLVILEGTLNSFFLGDYMRGGFFEGLAYALVIPLLSIVFFGVIAGTSLRKIEQANNLQKITYLILIATAFIGSIAVTLILASLRIAVDASEDYQTLAIDIWLSFINLKPIYPINTPGILLIALGIAFFIAAAIDVKSLDHSIPGFLQAFKTREKAHQEYNKKMEILNKKLMLAANTSKEISDAFDSLQAWRIEYQNIIINRQQLIGKFNSYIKHIEILVNNLLSKYRDINSTIRKSPPPFYFSNKWSYPNFISENTETTIMVKDFQEKITLVYKNIELIQREIEEEVKSLSSVISSVGTALERTRL